MTRPCCGKPPKDCYCAAMQEKGRKVEKVKGNEPTDADRERVWDLLDRFGLKPRAPVISSYANEALHEAIVELIAAVRAEYAPAVDLLRAMVERFPVVPHGETAMDREDWLADTQVQRAAVEWLAAHGKGGA